LLLPIAPVFEVDRQACRPAGLGGLCLLLAAKHVWAWRWASAPIARQEESGLARPLYGLGTYCPCAPFLGGRGVAFGVCVGGRLAWGPLTRAWLCHGSGFYLSKMRGGQLAASSRQVHLVLPKPGWGVVSGI